MRQWAPHSGRPLLYPPHVSTTAVRAEPPASRGAAALSAPTRIVAALSGTPALILKIILLAIVNAVGL